MSTKVWLMKSSSIFLSFDDTALDDARASTLQRGRCGWRQRAGIRAVSDQCRVASGWSWRSARARTRSWGANTGAARFDSSDAAQRADAARALGTTRPGPVWVLWARKCQRGRQRVHRASIHHWLEPRLQWDWLCNCLADRYMGRRFVGDSWAESTSPLTCNRALYRVYYFTERLITQSSQVSNLYFSHSTARCLNAIEINAIISKALDAWRRDRYTRTLTSSLRSNSATSRHFLRLTLVLSPSQMMLRR